MPKTAVDFFKTKIYKTACKDPAIKDVYVGSTTEIVKRRARHKSDCNNEGGRRHHFLRYYPVRKKERLNLVQPGRN